MTFNSGIPTRKLAEGQTPAAVQNLCSELSRTGQLYLRQISGLIDEIAPTPGSLIYVHANKLGVKIDGLEPVVFSAIDACTNLQVAQIHLASTVAATLSFVDLIVKCFPFSIQNMKTDRDFPIRSDEGRQARHDFRAMVAHQGIMHSFVAEGTGDALYALTSRLLFSKMTEGDMGGRSEHEHYRALTQFLMYHNNYRSIPWLDGNTPLQKLKSFEAYAFLHSFCLTGDSITSSAGLAIERANIIASTDSRTQSASNSQRM
jgi:hypothetical protein